MDNRDQIKKGLRKFYLSKRKELTEIQVQSKSHDIIKRVLQSKEYEDAESIHCYLAMPQNREVDTTELILDALNSGKSVVVPKMNRNYSLDHIRIDSLKHLRTNKWGVSEPVKGEIADLSELDLILIPMVAGDRYRNRLGYGLGYYDRFLNEVTAVKAGLLFRFQLHEDKLTVEPHDVPLDILFTESEKI
ncbi:MAG: 5-formyltetrahydrofolate cyclo-ligase [Balneolaceae bacterium]